MNVQQFFSTLFPSFFMLKTLQFKNNTVSTPEQNILQKCQGMFVKLPWMVGVGKNLKYSKKRQSILLP